MCDDWSSFVSFFLCYFKQEKYQNILNIPIFLWSWDDELKWDGFLSLFVVFLGHIWVLSVRNVLHCFLHNKKQQRKLGLLFGRNELLDEKIVVVRKGMFWDTGLIYGMIENKSKYKVYGYIVFPYCNGR